MVHASVGVSVGGSTPEDTTTTPVKLWWNAPSPVDSYHMAAGTTKASDWVTLGGFTSADKLAITIDLHSSYGNFAYNPSLSGQTTYYSPGADWYDAADITPPANFASTCAIVTKIEVK